MMLTQQDLIEHYSAMANEPFFEEDLQEIEQFYNVFSEKYPAETAAKQAIHFEYHDEKELILISDPDRTRIILAIFMFLKNHGFSFSLMTSEMQEDLRRVLKEKKVEQYKTYYCSSDLILMKQAADLACEWF